ncbi:MAG: ABC transporter ATP-binding protein [Caldilinea sp.]|jgi:molybdate transport system ATP-binding protein|uniref:ABC transporter ATP-binding protein n=1 Tax=Caldilinea sp. TaxID=2293560 RepID=UPI0030A8D835
MLAVRLYKRLPSFDLDLTLEAPPGVTALFGPSGAGKSMTLACIAGLARPDAGRIALNGFVFYDAAARVNVPPQRRRIGYVMQDYLLFPHLTVGENVAFGLHRLPRREREARVAAMLERMGLAGYETRRPQELSGGQQQRVALARALVTEPHALLLDEPFSALDAPTRAALRRDLLDLQRAFKLPVIFITHDFGEAYLLADQLAVLVEGKLLQCATPAEVVARPVNRQVAQLTGSRNFLSGQVLSSAEAGMTVRVGEMVLETPPAPWLRPGDAVTLAIRPERILLVRKDAPALARRNALQGVIVDELSDGFTCTLFLRSEGGPRLRVGAYDLEIVVPVYIYERLHIAEDRRWTVVLPQEAIQVM